MMGDWLLENLLVLILAVILFAVHRQSPSLEQGSGEMDEGDS